MRNSNALGEAIRTFHRDILADGSGKLADYIPELAKVDPTKFGVAIATVDGHVYEVGDSSTEFTIQSVSKAFVFALALELAGSDRVREKIGVEPSGEAFNSIRLRTDNRPFNAMVNAGAIACSGLVHEIAGADAFARIHDTMSAFAGRTLAIDEAVFASEQATGDRNRAIAYLLRNYGVVVGDVDRVLDVYFRQCSILVTARDLALMSATLANRGVHPLTGKRILSPPTVARALSVMMTAGMYDYAGEWIYEVGLPAKSGVGGGITATLPSQIGVGTYSPLLDALGNSVRGLKFCRALSSHFDLHVLNRSADAHSCIRAEYALGKAASHRARRAQEQEILKAHADNSRVFELAGALTFGGSEYVSRRLADCARFDFLILDFHRVRSYTKAAAVLLADSLQQLSQSGSNIAICGASNIRGVLDILDIAATAKVRTFDYLDEAMEWAEDQIVFRYGGFSWLTETTQLVDQELLADLTPDHVALLARAMLPRSYKPGEQIISAGEQAESILFLHKGMVSVKLPSGVRLATLTPGTPIGEMALLEPRRSADVWADTPVQCSELALSDYRALRDKHAGIGETVMRNLARILATRLVASNRKVGVLTSQQ